jgi:hypothetical protein
MGETVAFLLANPFRGSVSPFISSSRKCPHGEACLITPEFNLESLDILVSEFGNTGFSETIVSTLEMRRQDFRTQNNQTADLGLGE